VLNTFFSLFKLPIPYTDQLGYLKKQQQQTTKTKGLRLTRVMKSMIALGVYSLIYLFIYLFIYYLF
jgi:hypothetical protein